MNELFGSIAKYLNTRMKTPVYGVFSFWLIVLHWEFFYTLLFVDQGYILQERHMLKNEYLESLLSGPGALMWHIVSVLLAAFFTYLMIWVIPGFVLIRAFVAEQKHLFAKRLERIKLEKAVQEAEADLERTKTQSERQRLDEAEKRIAQEKKAEAADPAIVWEKEYSELMRLPLYREFGQLIECLYVHAGKVKVKDFSGRITFELDADILAYSDSNELVQYNGNEGVISLTDKGRFFVRRYQAPVG